MVVFREVLEKFLSREFLSQEFLKNSLVRNIYTFLWACIPFGGLLAAFTDSVYCAVPENIHTPSLESFSFCTPSPQGNSSLASHFASKTLSFQNPPPLGISNDLPWGRYRIFLELHFLLFVYLLPGVHLASLRPLCNNDLLCTQLRLAPAPFCLCACFSP